MDDAEETFGGDGDPTPAPYEELVSAMAGGLYSELERLVGAYGPGAVSGLLPQLVSVLESLQGACGQVRDRDQALEQLRDDRLRLLEQYERERTGRKRAEERFMELEDAMEQERKAHAAAVSRLEGQSRVLEGKARNYADQVAGLEEQKSMLLKELSALGQSHAKMVQSYKELKSQRVASAGMGPSGSSSTEGKRLKPLPVQAAATFLPRSSDPVPPESPSSPEEPGEIRQFPCSEKTTQQDTGRNNFPLAQEMVQPEIASPVQERSFDLEDLVNSTPELRPDPQQASSPLSTPLERNTVSLFAEVSGLSPELLSDMDDGADLQGDALKTLVAENTKLQEERIMLDTARRHLIARVEELTEERESLRMEREGMLGALSRCQAQLKEAELELIRIRQEFEERRHSSEDGEAEGSSSQPQKFTRAEMARVVMERNLYKERLMELQETVRRTDLLRASREEQAAQMKKSSFWKIFDRLFSPSDSPERTPASPLPPGRARSSPGSRSELGRNGGQLSPALRYTPRTTSPTSEADTSPQQKRRDLYREIRSYIWQEHGRAQIHGWSQPPALQGQDSPSGGINVPMLVQLRMLDQKDSSTKLWSAAVSLGPETQEIPETGSSFQSATGCPQLWVAAGTHSVSEVTLFAAQNSNHVLEHFVLPGVHVLSVACVPGLTVPSGESPEMEPEILKDPLTPGSDSEEETAQTGAVGTEPTVWFGTQEGCIYIHSSETDWRRCRGRVQLKDAVHCIVHTQGRVAAALGDGTVAIFHRNSGKQGTYQQRLRPSLSPFFSLNSHFLSVRNWDLSSPRLADLGRPRRCIRCAIPVLDRLWCGYGNRVYVLDPRLARIQRYFEVTSHPESQVRHMAAAGGGVWVSVRLESTLRLLHAETGQPLQEVDLGPFITRTLGPSGLSLTLNISALAALGKRLWVGTSGGTILSLPFVSEFAGSSEPSSPASIPYCAMEHAQISYHGHRDAVRFFVSVPGCVGPSSCDSLRESHSQENPSKSCCLVLSGGEGYINLRIGDDMDEYYGDLLLPNPRLRRAERSHLIVWQVQA